MGLKEELTRYAIESTKGFESKCLEDQLGDTLDNIRQVAGKSAPVTVADHFGNIITSTGTDDKIASFNTYGFDNDTLNWTLWMALYNDSWVFRRAIDKPSQDEINCGISIHGDKDYSKIYKAYDSVCIISIDDEFFKRITVYTVKKIKDEESHRVMYFDDINDLDDYIDSSDMVIMKRKHKYYSIIKDKCLNYNKEIRNNLSSKVKMPKLVYA